MTKQEIIKTIKEQQEVDDIIAWLSQTLDAFEKKIKQETKKRFERGELKCNVCGKKHEHNYLPYSAEENGEE